MLCRLATAFFYGIYWNILPRTIILRIVRAIAGKEKRPSCFHGETWLTECIRLLFDLFSFHQNDLTLVFKGMFFAVLKSAHYNINSATCGERSRQMHTQLILNKSVSLGMQNPHLEHSGSVRGPYIGGKNPGCSYRFPQFVRIFLHMQNTVQSFLAWTFPLSVWNGSFLAQFEIHFPLLCTKNIPSLSITHAVFKGKIKNIGC